MVGDGFSLIFMDTVSGTVYHKSKKFPIYAGAESPANYTTASESESLESFLSLFPLLLSLSLRLPVLITIYSQTSRAILLFSVMRYPPTRAGLPDGPPATTATITAAPNPTQQWAITLDGTVVGGEVSSSSTCLVLELDDGMADGLFLCVGLALGLLLGCHV